MSAARAWALVAAVAVAAVAYAAWPAPSGDGLGGGSAVRVGVRDGDRVPAYVESSRAELAGLRGERTVALVTLADYRGPDGAAALADGTDLLVALARVPLPGRQTELTRLPAASAAGLAEAMSRVAERKLAEAQGYRSRGATGDAAVTVAEADAYRVGCACVYALVVRGEPESLRGLAARSGVRAVDPAPEVGDLDRAVFVAPLPEQRDVVRPPVDSGSTDRGTPK